MRTFGLSEFLFIVQAAQWTLALSAIAFVGGALLGLVVALSRTSENAVARNAARVFIQVFQGTPLLLQLFLIFFGAPVLGFDINPWCSTAPLFWRRSGAGVSRLCRAANGKLPRP